MSDVRFAVTRVAAPTSTGTQDITVSGFGTCKAAFFIISGAVTDDTIADTAQIGFGATDGTRQWSHACRSTDASANVAGNRRGMTDKCVHLSLAGLSGVDGEAGFSAFITDGIRIDWTNAPASAFLVTVILVGGDDISVRADTINLGTATTAQTYSSMGFEANLLLCSGPNNAMADGNDTLVSSGFLGFIKNDGAGGITQRSMSWTEPSGSADGAPCTRMMEDKFGFEFTLAGGVIHEYTASNFGSAGFDFTSNANAGNDLFGFLAIDFPADVDCWVGTHDSPTGTGNNSSTAPGFTPQFVMLGLNACAAVDTTESDADGGVMGVSAFDDTRAYCNAMATEDAAATTNTASQSDDKAINLMDHTQNEDWLGTFSSFNADGWTINFSVTDGTARKWIGFAVEEASADDESSSSSNSSSSSSSSSHSSSSLSSQSTSSISSASSLSSTSVSSESSSSSSSVSSLSTSSLSSVSSLSSSSLSSESSSSSSSTSSLSSSSLSSESSSSSSSPSSLSSSSLSSESSSSSSSPSSASSASSLSSSSLSSASSPSSASSASSASSESSSSTQSSQSSASSASSQSEELSSVSSSVSSQSSQSSTGRLEFPAGKSVAIIGAAGAGIAATGPAGKSVTFGGPAGISITSRGPAGKSVNSPGPVTADVAAPT